MKICSDCVPNINFAETDLKLHPSNKCAKCNRVGLCIESDHAKDYITNQNQNYHGEI